MNSNEIDKFIEDSYWFSNEDIVDMREILLYFKKYSDIQLWLDSTQEEFNKAEQTIMEKIESGDYTYFFDKLKNGGYNHLIHLMKYSSQKEDIKVLVSMRQSLELDREIVIELIKATKDPKYIKSCIEKRKDFCFMFGEVVALIKSTNDFEYIKSCIEKNVELDLSLNDVIDLIKETKDPKYIKRWIEKRGECGFYSEDVVPLIQATGDIEYIKNCIEKREEFAFDAYDLKELIQATKDCKYIKSCIENREKFGLWEEDIIIDLISTTGDIEFIKACIADRESLGLTSKIIAYLALTTGDIEFIETVGRLKLEQTDLDMLGMFTQKTNIELPSEMTIGVEIESEGKNPRNIIEKLLEQNQLSWNVKDDGSLIDGTEVVSPILTGDTKRSSDEIRSVCATLKGCHQTISQRCGGHIHIGADYLTSKQDWINLIVIWGNAEKLLYIIGNEAEDIPREGVPQYASPISKKLENAMEQGTINLNEENDLDKFISELSQVQGDRYSGINFLNIRYGRKNTIEFRLPNGTINPNTWIENINLFGGIVRVAHDLTAIQNKTEDQRTEEERKMLESFEKIQTEQDETQILESLLQLTISPENRQIYMDRYAGNSLILRKSPQIEERITSQISTQKIGKKIFTGKDAVSGIEYQQGSALINQMLARNERQENVVREE